MAWTRRQLLELSAKLGLASLVPSLPGCPAGDDDDSGAAPWPPFQGCDPTTVDWVWDGAPGPETTFSHGVASGDPLADAVILWTRLSVEGTEPVTTLWEVSETADFAAIYASGLAEATAERDWTVKVDATCLRPSRTWHYRFSALGRTSPTGRTRTAAYGPTEHLRFAFCSCSSFPHGWYHAYRALAEQRGLDVVFHLGDYIYEFPRGEYGDERDVDPPWECVTLDDYRRRHRHHRADPDLQEAHRQHAFVCTWDDHEIANDTWTDGAQNHQEATEGTWADRKAAGMRAYVEWLPLREGAAGIIYRRLLYGDLLDVLVLDTRVVGRDAQPTTTEQAYDPARHMLGEAQERWLLDHMTASPARWTLLAQQCVMGRWSLSRDDQGRARPLNQDSWDGYVAARQRIFEHIAAEQLDGVVVISGDVHSSWANDLLLDFDDWNGQHTSAVAVEAVCPAITSAAPSLLSALLTPESPHLRWGQTTRQGFVVADVTRDRIQCDWHLLPEGAVESPEPASATVAASWLVRHGAPWWEEAEAPLEPVAV